MDNASLPAAPPLVDVLETSLYAADLAAARRFYGDILGLELLSEAEGRHLFFRLRRGMLLLFNPDATRDDGADVPPHGSEGAGHVALAVEPAALPAWRTRLAACGVAIEREVQWPSGHLSLYFRDPSGNSIELASPGIWGLPR